MVSPSVDFGKDIRMCLAFRYHHYLLDILIPSKSTQYIADHFVVPQHVKLTFPFSCSRHICVSHAVVSSLMNNISCCFPTCCFCNDATPNMLPSSKVFGRRERTKHMRRSRCDLWTRNTQGVCARIRNWDWRRDLYSSKGLARKDTACVGVQCFFRH